jgi:hypothetical protein
MGSFTRIAALALVTASFAACSTTVNEIDANGDPTQLLSEAELTGGEGREIAEDDTSPLDPEVIVDSDAPESTIPVAGTAADLLPDIGIDMSQLSAQIGDLGDEDATIARIEASWAAIKAEVTSTHPQHGPYGRRRESSSRCGQSVQPSDGSDRRVYRRQLTPPARKHRPVRVGTRFWWPFGLHEPCHR